MMIDKIYNCNIEYALQHGDDILDHSFICIARDEQDLANQIKTILASVMPDSTNMDEIINSYENFYLGANEFPYISIKAVRLFNVVEKDTLANIFDDLIRLSYGDIDILDRLKDLVIGHEYTIEYLRNHTIIHRSEILYYGDNDVLYSYREDSDYHKNGVNKFKLGDIVKIKYLENSPLFIVTATPTEMCTCIDWSNLYELDLYENKTNECFINIHESELEKVEEG